MGRTVGITTPEGEQVDYTLEASDICVVAAYKVQVTRLAATLDSFRAHTQLSPASVHLSS